MEAMNSAPTDPCYTIRELCHLANEGLDQVIKTTTNLDHQFVLCAAKNYVARIEELVMAPAPEPAKSVPEPMKYRCGASLQAVRRAAWYAQQVQKCLDEIAP